MITIGITGTLGAGKGTVVEYLVSKKGFRHYSVRNFLREEAIRRGLPLNRDTFHAVANDLRREQGSRYIIDRLHEEAEAFGQDAVIESVHNPAEAEAIKEYDIGYLLAVTADQRMRYERVKSRMSETDRVSFEKFQAQESAEITSTDPHNQNLNWCVEHADYQLVNNGTREELAVGVEAALQEILKNKTSAV